MNCILVVDGDDKALSLLYTDELTEEGYEVITKESRHGVRQVIQAKRPDMVVLDSTVAHNDMVHLLKDIRKVSEDLPIIVSTACAEIVPCADVPMGDPHMERSSSLRELKCKIRKASNNIGSQPEPCHRTAV